MIFPFDRQGNVKNTFNQYVPSVTCEYYTSTGLDKTIKSIYKVDDLTETFALTVPNAPIGRSGDEFCVDCVKGISRQVVGRWQGCQLQQQPN